MDLKYARLVMIFLLFSTITYASIELSQPPERVYNLGDKLSVELSLITDKDFDGFLRVTIACGDIQIPFFITPMKLQAKRQIIKEIPELTTSGHILGECRIISDLVSAGMILVDEKIEEGILITNKLNITFSGLGNYQPGQDITIEGELKKLSGEYVKNASLGIYINKKEYDVAVNGGIIRYPFKIPDDIKSGMQYITATAEDEYGNKAEAVAGFTVQPKPTTIGLSLNMDLAKPDDEIEIAVKLLDQIGDLMNSTMMVSIKNPGGDRLYSEDVQSNSVVVYHIDRYAMPGEYIIRAENGNIYSNKSLILPKIERLNLSYEDNLLQINNEGNVIYEDNAEIIAESGSKRFSIKKNWLIAPGELENIDLSMDLPGGVYNLSLIPSDNKLRIDYANPDGQVENKLINLQIDDNRALYKKMTQGISSITGRVIGSGEGFTTPFYILLLLIILLVILIVAHRIYYSRINQELEILPKKRSDVSRMLDGLFKKK